MYIIDTHTHLDHCENLEETLQAAAVHGIKAVLSAGVDLTSNKRNIEIKKKFLKPRIFLALGMHPGDIITEEIKECFEYIKNHLDEAIAVGEIGLDFWYKGVRKNEDKKEEQRFVFKTQLDLAVEYDLPVIIHSRGAWRECFETAQNHGITKAVFHWYSGPLDVLEEILQSGYFVSATPSLAYSPQARLAIQHTPIDQMLIETDTPVFYRCKEDQLVSSLYQEDYIKGFRSCPKDVVKTLNLYAELKGIKKEEAIRKLNANALRFFNLDIL